MEHIDFEVKHIPTEDPIENKISFCKIRFESEVDRGQIFVSLKGYYLDTLKANVHRHKKSTGEVIPDMICTGKSFDWDKSINTNIEDFVVNATTRLLKRAECEFSELNFDSYRLLVREVIKRELADVTVVGA